MIASPKQRKQKELDAAIMLASFTAEETSNASEEVVVPPSGVATERRILQSADKELNNTIGVDRSVPTIPKQMHGQTINRFPIMVRITHSTTSIYFFVSTPRTPPN